MEAGVFNSGCYFILMVRRILERDSLCPRICVVLVPFSTSFVRQASGMTMLYTCTISVDLFKFAIIPCWPAASSATGTA